MVSNNEINKKDTHIIENDIFALYPELLQILLQDRSSKKNIKWGTNLYSRQGYYENDFITIAVFNNKHKDVIRPRISKSMTEQKKRIKSMAEVFTPSRVCNKQNNLIDNTWFGYEGSFNKEEGHNWISSNKVNFVNDKTWIDYINEDRMEITCGEGPYLTSIYDTISGDFINVKDRIGLLDRKLRVLTENVETKEEWIEHSFLCLKSIYGYDYQGDNVFITRLNLLMTTMDFYYSTFKEPLDKETLISYCTIISWNVWQMDGLKFCIPNSCHKVKSLQMSLFEDDVPEEKECPGCEKNDILRHNGIYCYIKDWKAKKNIRFVDLMKGGFSL